METLGVWLHQTREAKGSTLQEAEAATRIRARFLEMLEAGDYAAFPGGEVQVRGFLRIYARYLGLSPDEVLARYETEVHGVEAATPAAVPVEAGPAPSIRPPAESAPFQPRDIPVSPSRTRWLAVGAVLLLSIALVVALAIAGRPLLASLLAPREEPPTATAAALVEVVSPTPTETPALPTATPTVPPNPEGGVTLVMTATEHVWVRVLTDGQTAFEGMMAPGQAKSWSGQEAVIVDTGNGAGLLVTVNGQPQGVLGGRGQICTRAWGPTGEIAVPSLAPTPTPEASTG